jgi:hypothetical protein
VTGLVAGGQAAAGTGICTTYLVFDLAVALVLMVQVWTLLRLLLRRRRLGFPLRGFFHALDQGRDGSCPCSGKLGDRLPSLSGFHKSRELPGQSCSCLPLI